MKQQMSKWAIAMATISMVTTLPAYASSTDFTVRAELVDLPSISCDETVLDFGKIARTAVADGDYVEITFTGTQGTPEVRPTPNIVVLGEPQPLNCTVTFQGSSPNYSLVFAPADLDLIHTNTTSKLQFSVQSFNGTASNGTATVRIGGSLDFPNQARPAGVYTSAPITITVAED
jgi:hypothetical protein